MRLSAPPARAASIRPTAEEPVKLMLRTWGLSKKASATAAASPGACVTTLMLPGGKPASSMISATSSPAESGASSDGLSTTVLPNTMGSSTVRHARVKAPFQGEKPATTPSGLRTASARRPGTSLGITSPMGLKPQPEAMRSWSATSLTW